MNIVPHLKIAEGSENYTCQVVKFTELRTIPGLDNLREVIVQGNSCLVGKDTDLNDLHLFFPTECQLSDVYVKTNNGYRDSLLNDNKSEKGFFEPTKRVKAIKFRGVISSGYVAPISTLEGIVAGWQNLQEGHEFNILNGIEICRKYVIKTRNTGANLGKSTKILDKIIDSKLAPEHFSTNHLLKFASDLNLIDNVTISAKLHGTSARYFNTLVYRRLNWFEKFLKKCGISIQTQEYKEVVGSRKVIKSVGFEELKNKSHYYKETGDIWTKVGEEHFKGKLHKGEAVYCEIVGVTHTGQAIQGGYSYNLTQPEVFIYRISTINPQGVEIDLSYQQMKERATQLGVKVCPEVYVGKLHTFMGVYRDSLNPWEMEKYLRDSFNAILEKPSLLDPNTIEEGFVLRIDSYPKPKMYKIKSKAFLLHEGKSLDKEVIDIEEEQK